MAISKKLVLFGTNRHAISINDFYMFFRRSNHEIIHIFYPLGSSKNRDWWEYGVREDKARDSIVDPMTECRAPITVWEDVNRDAAPILDRIDFDYICLGNGNDPSQKWLINRYGRDKFLFSEYGWLPWSGNFYISRLGAGFDSEIAQMTSQDVKTLSVNEAQITHFCNSLNKGQDVPYDDFIYMPLQKDVNDFKFLFNDFKDNNDFLRFADEIVPKEKKILVKRHPLYRKVYDISFSNRMIDITDENYNKYIIYNSMDAMICLNSTSILEALAFGGTVFSYGDDLFVGKDLTFHKVMNPNFFAKELDRGTDANHTRKFISLLMSRQITRQRCVKNDTAYVKRHYWNVSL